MHPLACFIVTVSSQRPSETAPPKQPNPRSRGCSLHPFSISPNYSVLRVFFCDSCLLGKMKWIWSMAVALTRLIATLTPISSENAQSYSCALCLAAL